VNAPSLNTGSVKEVRRRHRHGHAGRRERGAEVAHDPIAFRGVASIGTRSSSWKLTPHAPSSARQCTGDHRIERRPHELAERVATAVADRPQAERELVRRGGIERHVSTHLLKIIVRRAASRPLSVIFRLRRDPSR
jgi:hypothetical protein